MNPLKISRLLYPVLVLFISLFILTACSDEQPTEPPFVVKERGEIISTNKIGTFTAEGLQTVIDLSELEVFIQPEYGVDAIKIVYQTIDYYGEKVRASGALFIPKTTGPLPLLSLQHGTVTKNTEAASVNPFGTAEGLIGTLTGSIGFISAVPDLLGFGESKIIHPYVHDQGNSQVVIDFLRAARHYCQNNNITLNDKLFLAGYSEGGYITMATHREIETNFSSEFSLTAVSPMAGPHDLEYTVTYLLGQQQYDWPAYAAFFIVAYDEVYRWDRLDYFFAPQYAGNIKNYFRGGYSFGEINSQLPDNIQNLLNPTFVQSFMNGNETDLNAALQENTLLDWAPVAPIRMYHGDADVTVPYQNSVIALENLTSSGAVQIELITISGGDHATAGLPAIDGAIQWFYQMK